MLGVRGLLNGRIIGDRDLLNPPGAQTVLQPNVLTADDRLILRAISNSAEWLAAVDSLVAKSIDPNDTGSTFFMPGLVIDPATNDLAYQSATGPGLAIVTNPLLQDPSAVASHPEGYITVAENNDPELSSPVAMHVIRVSREKYRGSIAVLEPDNVFDEKLSLKHIADFGGNVKDLYFEWYIREEDGRNLNPPGVANPTAGAASGSDWTLFEGGRGLNTIQMEGTGPVLIRDNLFFCRYGFSDDGSTPTEWSAYAGAANSREPDASSPTVATDVAYVAQLAAGWIKRVTNVVNAFDARIRDSRNNDSSATYTSMLQQAGQRHEGPVAFNPEKDAIENVGLIELYQTVLDRAEDLTINTQSGTSGVNAALLNAANRIAAFYVLLGNEAYADALDPTIGFSTQSGDFGNLAPTIHAFENVTANLLEEELALLRGRSEVGARPAYNRLIWNFTNGTGEAAYVMNYDINDVTEDGFINDADARRLYPQGHGDAWGHYTMALSGYYRLARIANFNWEPRSEKYNIDGVVLDVDYLDERAFARAAAARAQAGSEIVDLVYRKHYTENPDGQWQGYTDTDADRAWGVFETAQRSGTAALYDWMMANAILQAEETDPQKIGIRRVDRSTVGELAAIASSAQAIQAKLNSADGGMNPAGLDPNVVPFDIDPVRTERSSVNPATHFEQIYERAVGAAVNALRSFEHANQIALQLRETEASSEELRKKALDQDLSYRNELIEMFGTPYEGTIGAGQAYPAGYNGPDLFLFLYVDQVAAGGDILPNVASTVVETTIVPGLRNLATGTNPFSEEGVSINAALANTVSTYFPADLALPSTPVGEITLNLPRAASGYALVAPNHWGARRSPGAIQAAVQELVRSEWQLRTAMNLYESQADDFQNLLRKFELISGIAGESIEVVSQSKEAFNAARTKATDSYRTSLFLGAGAELAYDLGDAVATFLPESAGTSIDATSVARGVAKLAGSLAKFGFLAGSVSHQVAQLDAEIDMDAALANLDRALVTQDRKIEIIELLFEINDLINSEGDKLLEVVNALEAMRAASDRVASSIERGQALIEERTVFNQRVAATTTKQRYEDFTFRVFHNEALRKYRSSFDLATRYAYLAGKAYQYELNLPDNHPANARPILSGLLRERSLGAWGGDGQPVLGQGGVAEHLAVLKANFDTFKGQLGFNNPTDDVYAFSLRRELERVGMASRVSGDWRTALENYRVPDLWNYEYQNIGVNYGYVFRRFCRPFAAEGAGAQPALVIPFTTTIEAGKNWFGKELSGGDSSFNSSDFSTKIRSVGVRFDGYNNSMLSQTPQVYLVPVGTDRMFLPNSNSLESRGWNVVDQQIPAPLPITPGNLSDPDWQPFSGSANGFFEGIRKFSSFRAYHDAGGWSLEEMLNNGRHVGRSVWNAQWVLIIPNASLLFDNGNSQAGIDTLIYGAPLPTFDQSTAGTSQRDGVGIDDIRILIDGYSISGN